MKSNDKGARGRAVRRNSRAEPPERLPQRWAIILSISTALAVIAGGLASIAIGVTVALAAAGLLHQIVD